MGSMALTIPRPMLAHCRNMSCRQFQQCHIDLNKFLPVLLSTSQSIRLSQANPNRILRVTKCTQDCLGCTLAIEYIVPHCSASKPSFAPDSRMRYAYCAVAAVPLDACTAIPVPSSTTRPAPAYNTPSVPAYHCNVLLAYPPIRPIPESRQMRNPV